MFCLRSILVTLLCLVSLVAVPQVVTTNASGPCTCDGTATINPGIAAPFGIEVNTGNGTVMYDGVSANPSIFLNGLCPGVYTYTLVGSTAPDGVFNIAAAGVNPGVAVEETLCSSDGPFNMTTALTGYVAGGSWTLPSGAATDATFIPAIENSGLFIYTITSGGCPVSTGVLINEIQNASAGLSTTYLICENYAEFDMTTILNGNPQSGGQWYAQGAVPVTATYDPATMNPGQFTYMVNGINGCPNVFATLTIIENQFPDPGENTSILVCTGAAPFSMFNQIEGTPMSGGDWFDDMGNPVDDIFDPSTDPAGVYQYHVDGQTPCTDQDSYLTIDFTTTNPSGQNGTVAVCASDPGFNMINFLGGSPEPGGTWRNAQNQIVDGFFIPGSEPAGTYSYYYPNVGCTPLASQLVITVEQQPTAGTDQSTTVCATAANLNLSSLLSPGTTAGGTWTQGGVPAGPVFDPVNAGVFVFSYTVTGTECPSDQSQITVTVQAPPPAINDIDEYYCSTEPSFGLSTLYPGYPTITFEDTGGNALTIFDPATQGSQIITAILPSGNTCPASSAEINVIVEEPAFSSSDVNVSVCETEIQFDLNLNGYPADYTNGVWTDDQAQEISPLINLDFTGSQSFTFTSNPGNACASSVLTVELQVDEAVVAGPDATASLCYTDAPVTLSELMPGEENPSGTWTIGGVQAPPLFDPSVAGSGTYTFTLPANGDCPGDEAELVISVENGVEYSAGDDIAECTGSGNVVLGQGSPNGYSVSWSPDFNISSTSAANPQVTLLNAGNAPLTTTYTVEYTNGVCSFTDDVQVTVYPSPTVDADPQLEACYGEVITASASGGTSYAWEPASFFDDPSAPAQSWTAEEDITVTVNAFNDFGCSASGTIALTVYPLPDVSVSPEPGQGCPPVEYNAVVTQGEHFSTVSWWINGDPVASGDELNVILDEPGSYNLSLSAVTAEGCTVEFEWPEMITVHPLPVADFFAMPATTTILNPEISFVNTSTGAESYSWNFLGLGSSAEEHPVWVFPDNVPGSYAICLEATSIHGCTDSICAIVRVENTTGFYAPTAFSPDNDGINELFRPVFFGFDVLFYEFVIFDRWGQEVFRTEDPEAAWNGSVSGGAYYAQPDVYIWQVRLKNQALAEYETYRGHVTLLR